MSDRMGARTDRALGAFYWSASRSQPQSASISPTEPSGCYWGILIPQFLATLWHTPLSRIRETWDHCHNPHRPVRLTRSRGGRDGSSILNKPIAEFIGTFTLVLFGCGAAVIAGPQIGVLGISFAFGLALIAMAYGIGQVSGCHINPAVSVGLYVAGRMGMADLVSYVIAQVLGGIAGAFVLYIIVTGKLSGYDVSVSGLGQNGWGPGYLGEYGLGAAFVFEVVATFLFVVTILGSTEPRAHTAIAGLSIGLALVVIHIVGIQITGVSVNPARSIGPALLVGANALAQLWLFIVAPLIGAVAAGLMFRGGILLAPIPEAVSRR